MVFNPQIHQRRSIRHRGHDYGAHGAYFITVCTHRRAPLFGHIASGQMHPNDAGRMVQSVWDEIPAHFPHVALDEFVVMPDHVHGILIINDGCKGTACRAPTNEQFGQPVPGSIPTIIRSFKSAASQRIGRGAVCQFQSKLWQRNYWERIIRSDDELRATRRYIQNNPMRWQNR